MGSSQKHYARKVLGMLNLMHKKMSATTVNEISTTTIPTSTQNKRTVAIIADQKRRTSENVSTIKFPKKPKSLKKTNPPKKKKTKDQNAPKRPLSSYFFFQMEIRKKFTTPGKIDIKKCFPKVKIFL